MIRVFLDDTVADWAWRLARHRRKADDRARSKGERSVIADRTADWAEHHRDIAVDARSRIVELLDACRERDVARRMAQDAALAKLTARQLGFPEPDSAPLWDRARAADERYFVALAACEGVDYVTARNGKLMS